MIVPCNQLGAVVVVTTRNLGGEIGSMDEKTAQSPVLPVSLSLTVSPSVFG